MQAQRLLQSGVEISSQTKAEWQFEQEWQKHQSTADPSELEQRLRTEERILLHIQEGRIDDAYDLSKKSPYPFHDLLEAQGKDLVIQKLTLSLNDTRAEQVKRERLESSWDSGSPPNAELLNIARNEILGGDPEKGLATLYNLQIDEFSDIELLNEQAIVQQLGELAHIIFLNPAAAKKSCEQDSQQALENIDQFFSSRHLQLTESLWNTPNIQQAWKAQIALALLYRNAGTCDLLISLHTHQLINSALQFQAKNEQDLITLVYLIRSIRRYEI